MSAAAVGRVCEADFTSEMWCAAAHQIRKLLAKSGTADPRELAAALGLRVVAVPFGPDAAADAECVVFRLDASEAVMRERAAVAFAMALLARTGAPWTREDAERLASLL